MDCLFIINPASGGMEGQNIADTLNRDFTGSGKNIQAVFLNRHNPVGQLTSLAPGKDLVVIGGGDGTVSLVASCLSELDSPPPFAIMPIGTGNDLARNTGWFRIWQSGGLDALFTAISLSKAESIDVWSAGRTNRFICYAGIGIDASIIDFISRHRYTYTPPLRWHGARRLMTRLLYIAAAFRFAVSGTKTHYNDSIKMEFFLKGQGIRSLDASQAQMVVIASIDRYGGGGHLSSKANRGDGIFEVYAFHSLQRYISFVLKSRIGSKFAPDPDFRADKLDVYKKKKLLVQLDGEPAVLESDGTKSSICIHRAIPVLIPPDDLAARERIRKPFHAKQKVKAEVSPAIPGAAAIKHSTAQKQAGDQDNTPMS